MTKNLASASLLLNAGTQRVLKKVDGSARKDVEHALLLFRNNPVEPKLRFERLKGFANLYTIRANLSLRIYMADSGEMKMQIIHIGNHDFAKKVR